MKRTDKGASSPNGDDARGAIQVGSSEYPLTPNLEAFLVSELHNFKGLTRDGSHEWKPARLARQINHCKATHGTVDDETIRRFLLPKPPQSPKPETFAMVAAFLLDTRWISPHAVAAHAADIRLRAALELRTFFSVPESDAQTRFQRGLEGSYIGYELDDNRLYETSLTLAFSENGRVLRVTDGTTSYLLGSREAFLRRSNGLDPALYPRFPELLKECAGRPADHSRAGGFAVTSTDLLALLLRDESKERPVIYTVLDIGFDEDDTVAFLAGLRNGGWAIAEHPPMPEVRTGQPIVRRGLPVEFCIFRLARDMSKYSANMLRGIAGKNEDRLVIKKARYYMDSRERTDLLIERSLNQVRAARAFYAAIEDPTDRLAYAIDGGDLDYALQAIDDGADINAVHPRANLPFIHMVAGSANRELLQKLLDTGTCDLTVRDRRDLLPGDCATMFADDPDIAEMLRKEQAQQFVRSGKDPRSPAVGGYGSFKAGGSLIG